MYIHAGYRHSWLGLCMTLRFELTNTITKIVNKRICTKNDAVVTKRAIDSWCSHSMLTFARSGVIPRPTSVLMANALRTHDVIVSGIVAVSVV